MKNDTNLSGSYTELTVDKTLLRVSGFSLTTTLNCISSEVTHHCTASALSMCGSSKIMDRSLTALAHSSSRIEAKTSLPLEMNLGNQSLPVLQSSLTYFTSWIARLSYSMLVSPSTTQKFFGPAGFVSKASFSLSCKVIQAIVSTSR